MDPGVMTPTSVPSLVFRWCSIENQTYKNMGGPLFLQSAPIYIYICIILDINKTMASNANVRLPRTTVSLNERFTQLRRAPRANVGTIRATASAYHQSTIKNRRLAQQMENRPAVMAALRLKKRSINQQKRSLNQRLGIQKNNVQQRLNLRGRMRGRFVGGSVRGRSFSRRPMQRRQNNSTRGGGGRFKINRNVQPLMSQSFGSPRSRGNRQGRRQWTARTRSSPNQPSNYTRGRGGNRSARGNNRFERGNNSFQQGRGRGRGRGRGGRGRGQNQRPVTSVQELDAELESYMSNTASQLNKELDSYMENKEDNFD